MGRGKKTDLGHPGPLLCQSDQLESLAVAAAAAEGGDDEEDEEDEEASLEAVPLEHLCSSMEFAKNVSCRWAHWPSPTGAAAAADGAAAAAAAACCCVFDAL